MAATLSLQRKVALVTGAQRGIRLATSKELHRRGARVVMVDLDADGLERYGASAGVAYFGFIDTDMVRQAFSDPIAREVEEAFPSFVTKRLKPAVAGSAIVDGIERRAPRTIRPRWWAAWSVLRGIVNPVVDKLSTRDEHIERALREGDRRAAADREVERSL